MLDIDGKKVKIGGLDLDQFSKGDIQYAFSSYGEDKITFSKKGSELKLLVAQKKAMYEAELVIAEAKKVVIAKELMDNDKIDVTADGADQAMDNAIYARDNETESISSDLKNKLRAYRDLMWKCKSIEENVKTCETLLDHLEDKKSYKMTVRQLTAISKGIEEEVIKGASIDEVEVEEEAAELQKAETNEALKVLGL